MNEQEQLEWKIKELEEIKKLLLARGATSIKSTLNRRIDELKLPIVVSEEVEG